MTESHPPWIPEELAKRRFTCDACGRNFGVNFFKQYDFPFDPVHPNNPPPGGGVWKRLSINWQCPHCNEWTQLPIALTTIKGHVHLYGDEAYRDHGRHYVVSMTCVGGSPRIIDEVAERVRELKRKAIPALDPTRWKIHTTDMWSGQRRTKSAVYSRLKGAAARDLLFECADVVRQHEDVLWSVNVSGIYQLRNHPKTEQERIRKDLHKTAHIAVLSYLTFELTKQGALPKFYFDATKPIVKEPHIEGWSRNMFLGSKHFLAHAFLSHSNEIPAPEFVKPGSHPCLELADIHSFAVARTYYCGFERKNSDFDTAKFGRSLYLSIKSGQDMVLERATGLPQKFLPAP